MRHEVEKLPGADLAAPGLVIYLAAFSNLSTSDRYGCAETVVGHWLAPPVRRRQLRA